MPEISSKRFRVAISFAGQKRSFVEQVANILAARFGEQRILYDRFHEAEFANPNLGLSLPTLYLDEADLVVVVLCRDYQSSEWCGLEWRAVNALVKESNAKRVMLTRFDRVEAASLLCLGGFLELDSKSSEDTAKLILERLALNDGLPRETYVNKSELPPPLDWPESPPELAWPVANHQAAQSAFARLLTRGAPFRILPIFGDSEMGKSHLTKQFYGTALRTPNLRCGRLDFKGATDIGAEIRNFAQHLGIDAPDPAKGTYDQLNQVLASLRRLATPTLLIFDTFEQAGNAERWVLESLLISVVRCPWLRVVVVGQRTATPHGEAWAGFSSPAIEAQSPSAHDWFTFGVRHRPEIDLAFVQQLHTCVAGRPSVLAQVLGPRG